MKKSEKFRYSLLKMVSSVHELIVCYLLVFLFKDILTYRLGLYQFSKPPFLMSCNIIHIRLVISEINGAKFILFAHVIQ